MTKTRGERTPSLLAAILMLGGAETKLSQDDADLIVGMRPNRENRPAAQVS